MILYFIKRIFISLPTLLGISFVCFVLAQFTPGGPVEQAVAQWTQAAGEAGQGGGMDTEISEEQLESLKAYYGFDKPVLTRYFLWLGKVIQFDFGESWYYEEPVIEVLVERLPVSVIFGVFSFVLTYLVCIPLGILKAIKNHSPFDIATSVLIFTGYSIPAFAFGLLLIVFFCGGSFWDIFPIGFKSDFYDELSFFEKVLDIAHHMVLPLICYVIGAFALKTMLMKNSLLEQLKQDYVTTARAKGLSEKLVIARHATRNALLPIASGFGHFISIFFAGSLLIEVIFNLDGIGLLSYESILRRDYPVVLANIMIGSVLYIVGNMISDLLYIIIDPRIDFS